MEEYPVSFLNHQLVASSCSSLVLVKPVHFRSQTPRRLLNKHTSDLLHLMSLSYTINFLGPKRLTASMHPNPPMHQLSSSLLDSPQIRAKKLLKQITSLLPHNNIPFSVSPALFYLPPFIQTPMQLEQIPSFTQHYQPSALSKGHGKHPLKVVTLNPLHPKIHLHFSPCFGSKMSLVPRHKKERQRVFSPPLPGIIGIIDENLHSITTRPSAALATRHMVASSLAHQIQHVARPSTMPTHYPPLTFSLEVICCYFCNTGQLFHIMASTRLSCT